MSAAVPAAVLDALDLLRNCDRKAGRRREKWDAHPKEGDVNDLRDDATLTGVLAHAGMAECTGGLFGVIAALMGLRAGWIPPLAGTGCPQGAADFVLDQARSGEFRRALVIGSNERGSHGAVVVEAER